MDKYWINNYRMGGYLLFACGLINLRYQWGEPDIISRSALIFGPGAAVLGATYIPALDLDSSDKETFDRITNYQNNYAKLFGMPKIIPVVYDKYGNDEVEEDFKEFWDQVGTGEIKHNEDGTSTRVEKSNKKETNESASFKYIIPYTNFI